MTDFTSLLFNDEIPTKFLTVLDEKNQDVEISMSCRAESTPVSFIDTMYSHINYEITHTIVGNAPCTFSPMIVHYDILDGLSHQVISKRDILYQSQFHWISNTTMKHKLKFLDCTYHSQKRPWSLRITWYQNNQPILCKISPPFLVYARKKETRKRDDGIDKFSSILQELEAVVRKLDPDQQPKALKMIRSSF